MLILSRVCAEFRDHTGAVVYRVTPESRLTFREAPDSVREDPLFRMLVNEGSLEAVSAAGQRKVLEADPLKDTDAAGRKIPAPAPDPDPGTRAKSSCRKRNAPAEAPEACRDAKTIDEP